MTTSSKSRARQDAMQAAQVLNLHIKNGTVITASEAATLLGYSHQGVIKMMLTGKLPNLGVGHAHFTLRDHVVEYSLRKRGGGTSE